MAYSTYTPYSSLSAIRSTTQLPSLTQNGVNPSNPYNIDPYINPQTGQVSTSPNSVAPGAWTTYQPQQVGAQSDPISYDPSTTTATPTSSTQAASSTDPMVQVTGYGYMPQSEANRLMESLRQQSATQQLRSGSGSSSGSYTYDPLALARLNNESALALQNDQQSYQQNAISSDFERRLAAIRSLSGGTGGSTGGSSGGTGSGGGSTSVDEQASRNAAFARAKDQQGQTARASLDALRGIMSESGTLGSGMEAMGQANIISGAASDLGDFERERLMSDSDRAASIADRNYAGDLTRQSLEQQKFQALLGILTSGRAY